MTRASDQPAIAVGNAGWEHIIHNRTSLKGKVTVRQKCRHHIGKVAVFGEQLFNCTARLKNTDFHVLPQSRIYNRTDSLTAFHCRKALVYAGQWQACGQQLI